mmetsp:Transcript_781/g.1263  ORF Transcript_781/g.1263 Transcript_781/m.1263 type:complete len:298 (+) Transcript_781:108-1001(+)
MSGPRKPSSYDAFAAVDSLVSKPVLGSDGAASWQEFQSNHKSRGASSRGVAPHLPLKRSDKLSGMKSIQEERRNEQQIRSDCGDRQMGSGYTVFKRKNTMDEAVEKKRRKMIQDRKRPEDQTYFIKAENFQGWKEDYIFTTRDSQTGYYWDGMDSIKKLNGADLDDSTKQNDDITNHEGSVEAKTNSSKKKKKKAKDHKHKKKDEAVGAESDLPKGWQMAMDPATGKTYYYNVELNKTLWEKPIDESGSIKSENKGSETVPVLPSGWETAKDPSSGKEYFYNRSLNKTSWERPKLDY